VRLKKSASGARGARSHVTAKQEPGRQHAGSGNATILVPVSFGVELLVPVREAEFKARRLNFEFGDPDGPFDGYFIFAGIEAAAHVL